MYLFLLDSYSCFKIQLSASLLLLSVSLKFLMELLLLLRYSVIPFFLLYIYLFFYRDCQLLKVQHCTHLPFVNDLDLLRTK